MTKRRHNGTSKAAMRERNERFVNAYLSKGENATQAYLEIKPGVATNSAATEGYRLLKLPEIQRAIEQRRAEIRNRFALTAERVFQELGRVSYFDPRKLVDANGKPIPLHKLDDDTAAALSAIELEQRGEGKDAVAVTRWRPFDKMAALGRAVKILRLEDKPPPPPPDADGHQRTEDPRELAKRVAFLLRRGAVADVKAQEKPARPAKKKLALPA